MGKELPRVAGLGTRVLWMHCRCDAGCVQGQEQESEKRLSNKALCMKPLEEQVLETAVNQGGFHLGSHTLSKELLQVRSHLAYCCHLPLPNGAHILAHSRCPESTD